MSVAEILAKHVTLELECVDRMYLNVYVPRLQSPRQIAWFFHMHRGMSFASSALMAPMSHAFVETLLAFARREGAPLVRFEKGTKKEDVAAEHLRRFEREEGVLFLGVAQEKTRVFRTEKRRNPTTGAPYPWIVPGTAMINHYYLYALDREFGLFFLKFASYFPYTGRLCFNGHEFVKRQATRAGLDLEPLENGVARCAHPGRLQRLADTLTAERIERFARKWLGIIPSAFTDADRAAGYGYELSVLQAEFSLTQVLDRPLTGRLLFEQLIRENLDLGRPDQVSIVFDRRIVRRGRHPTPGRFRTRIITQGVSPSLYVYYRGSSIKQYHKEGRALRTETTVNDTRDLGIGKRLSCFAALRQAGFAANRRLLAVQRISHDCTIGEDAFAALTGPVQVGEQRASGLRPGSERTMAVLGALLVFRLLPRGFSAADLRDHLAPLLGLAPDALSQGRITYELRRLRLHGLIERVSGTYRYRVSERGLHEALFLVRTHIRLFRPGLSDLDDPSALPSPIRAGLTALDAAIDRHLKEVALAA
jgi:hypothetical protein